MFSIGVPDQAALSGDCTRTSIGPKPDLCIPFVRAACHAFQNISHSSAEDEDHQVTLSSTAIVKYVGIEKRNGLVSVGRRLLEGDRTLNPPVPSLISATDVPHDNLDISWHRSHHDSHPQPHNGRETIAISAFLLSTLQTSLKQKRVVKEMWESGAGTIVRRLIAFYIFVPNPS
jgi:hypothetical protein